MASCFFVRAQSHSLIRPLHISLVPAASIHLFLFLVASTLLQNGSPALCSSAASMKKRTFSSARGISIHSRLSAPQKTQQILSPRLKLYLYIKHAPNESLLSEREKGSKKNASHKKLLPVIISTRRKNPALPNDRASN